MEKLKKVHIIILVIVALVCGVFAYLAKSDSLQEKEQAAPAVETIAAPEEGKPPAKSEGLTPDGEPTQKIVEPPAE